MSLRHASAWALSSELSSDLEELSRDREDEEDLELQCMKTPHEMTLRAQLTATGPYECMHTCTRIRMSHNHTQYTPL